MPKKISIPFSNLTPIYVDGQRKYMLRYRVVSDDRNRFSEWSPLYDINAPQAYSSNTEIPAITRTLIQPKVANITLDEGSIITLYWSVPPELLDVRELDVFIRRFDPVANLWTNWSYLNTQPQGPITVVNDGSNDYSKLDISVHLPSYPKQPVILTDLPASSLFQNNDELDRSLEIFKAELEI